MTAKGPSFDPVAAIYEPFEYLTFGGALMRRRLAFLDSFAGATRVLILGDGDGRFTAALVARYPDVQITAVDSSGAMLDRLAARVRKDAPGYTQVIDRHCKDAREFSPNPGVSYDRVVTHFFFDCFTTDELHAMIARIVPALTADARWIVSDFAVPSTPWRWLARLLVRALYLAFRLLTGLRVVRLPDHVAALERASFVQMEKKTALGGVLISELWRRGDTVEAKS